jgi:hypothetical protein
MWDILRAIIISDWTSNALTSKLDKFTFSFKKIFSDFKPINWVFKKQNFSSMDKIKKLKFVVISFNCGLRLSTYVKKSLTVMV